MFCLLLWRSGEGGFGGNPSERFQADQVLDEKLNGGEGGGRL